MRAAFSSVMSFAWTAISPAAPAPAPTAVDSLAIRAFDTCNEPTSSATRPPAPSNAVLPTISAPSASVSAAAEIATEPA